MTITRLGGQVSNVRFADPLQTRLEAPSDLYSNFASCPGASGAIPYCAVSVSVSVHGPSVPRSCGGGLGSLDAAGTPTRSEAAAEAMTSDRNAAPATAGTRPR